MGESESRRRKLFEELRKRLSAKEQSRAAIKKDISQLTALGRELEKRLEELDLKRKELEKLFTREHKERDALIGRKALLERELSELEGKLKDLGQVEGLYREGLMALRQQEEGILGEYEAKLKILLREEKTTRRAAEAKGEKLPPKVLSSEPARQAPEAPPPRAQPAARPATGLKTLKVRDPEGELCAAFLEGRHGLVVMQTEAYLNYLRRSLHQMNTLHKRYLSLKLETPNAAVEATEAEFEDFDRIKRFLMALTSAVIAGRLEAMWEVEGARITSTLSRKEGRFELEAGTSQVVNSRVLRFLGKLLDKDVESFFRDDGPYDEICEYLSACQKFMEDLGRERRGRALLKQLRSDTRRRAPDPGRAPDKATFSGLIPQGIEEQEEVRELEGVSFDEGDKASILSQEERAVDLSNIELKERRPFDLSEAEARLRLEGLGRKPDRKEGEERGER